jgi:nicotinate-nucleotide pyrophosphorylase (carboxylating)
MGLFDMILIKENHIRWVGSLRKTLENVIEEIGESRELIKLEVEVTNLAQLEEVLDFKIDRVMLDNFSIDQIRNAVSIARRKVKLEVSGGVTIENVVEIAATGVNYISVGALTHSVKNFDLSLLLLTTKAGGENEEQTVDS